MEFNIEMVKSRFSKVLGETIDEQSGSFISLLLREAAICLEKTKEVIQSNNKQYKPKKKRKKPKKPKAVKSHHQPSDEKAGAGTELNRHGFLAARRQKVEEPVADEERQEVRAAVKKSV